MDDTKNDAEKRPESTVFLIDDQPDVLNILTLMVRRAGWCAESFVAASDFLKAFRTDRPGCLVMDLRMPGTSGVELQKELMAISNPLPIIVVTGYADLSDCITAIRHGVFDILHKPVMRDEFLDCVGRALAFDLRRRTVHAALDRLTPRERDVLDQLIAGRRVKEIALDLQIGFQTAAKHRSSLLKKLDVDNEVELLRLVFATREEFEAKCRLPRPHLRIGGSFHSSRSGLSIKESVASSGDFPSNNTENTSAVMGISMPRS